VADRRRRFAGRDRWTTTRPGPRVRRGVRRCGQPVAATLNCLAGPARQCCRPGARVLEDASEPAIGPKHLVLPVPHVTALYTSADALAIARQRCPRGPVGPRGVYPVHSEAPRPGLRLRFWLSHGRGASAGLWARLAACSRPAGCRVRGRDLRPGSRQGDLVAGPRTGHPVVRRRATSKVAKLVSTRPAWSPRARRPRLDGGDRDVVATFRAARSVGELRRTRVRRAPPKVAGGDDRPAKRRGSEADPLRPPSTAALRS
jgi:hypothetical protein